MFQTVSVAQDRNCRAPNVSAFSGKAACKDLSTSFLLKNIQLLSIHELNECLCLCVLRSQPEDLCILNVGLSLAVSMSLCSFQAGLCHNDPLFFMHEGVCNPADVASVEWAKFRASLAPKSSVQQPCGPDTCYEWETCSGEGWGSSAFCSLSRTLERFQYRGR